MNNDKKDIQYKILKSEACGHAIEYKIVKKEHELEKARIDEGLSPREKMKAREARSSKEREPKELSSEQYETGKKIARTKAVTETGEKQRKQTLKDVLHTHKQNAPKAPSKEDLEYPMAASEEDCSCEDKTEKCECEDKEMKKREKFYIQKIQELRKFLSEPTYINTGKISAADALKRYQKDKNLQNTGVANQNRVAAGLPMLTQGTQSNQGEYILQQAPKGSERSLSPGLMSQAGVKLPATAAPATAAPATAAPATAAPATAAPATAAPATAAPATAAPAGTAPTRSAIVGDSEFETSFANKRKEQGLPPENLSATQTATPAAPQRMQFGKDSGVSFKDAFAQARKSGNQEFDWYNPKTGKTQPYHTYSKEEFQQGKTLAAGRNPEGFQSQAIGADNKYFKGYQAQQKAPTAQAPTAQTPAAAQTKAQVTRMNPDGSISSTESDGRKTLTMPKEPIKIATPGQQQVISGPGSSEAGPDSAVVTGIGKTPGRSTIKAVPTNTRTEANLKNQPNQA